MRQSKPEELRQRRSVFLTGMITLVVIGLGAQLANVSINQQQTYVREAEEQRTRYLPVYASRGLIYDRNMESLVTNRPGYSVSIRYPYYKKPEVLQRLAAILNMPQTDIEHMVAKKIARQRYFEPVRLKDGITQEQHAKLLERTIELPGVEVEAHPIREYPNKDMAAHLLGYVNEVSSEDIAVDDEKKYIGGELIGRTGLEGYYDDYLRGKPGLRQVEINNYFQPLGETQTQPPQPGNSVVLTIDANLQRAAERALDWDMWRIRNTLIGDGPWRNARAGAVVVMDVKTGAILAMASHPGFDPNLFARGITEAELTRLRDPVLTPEVNRVIQTAYQPGSTWKMLTSAAALTNGAVGPYEKIYCSGKYDKAGNPRCWQPWGHGWVSTVEALRDSCDIYYYEMGYRMGPDKIVDMAKQFGFGEKTGIDLGGEIPGLLPDAAVRAKLWGDGADQWSVGHTVSSAIGQIVNVTPLQLVRYAATLANHGKVMQPYLVQRIVDDQGRTVKEFQPVQKGQVKVSQENLNLILQGMLAVNSPGGTSDYGIYPLPGMNVGGKTGTAEYPPHDDFGFYVSVSPIEDPQIAIAVVIEQAGHGGSTAAVARSIESAYYKIPLPSYDPASVPKEFPNDPAGLRQKYRVVGSGT